jgi:hypothetical protein
MPEQSLTGEQYEALKEWQRAKKGRSYSIRAENPRWRDGVTECIVVSDDNILAFAVTIRLEHVTDLETALKALVRDEAERRIADGMTTLARLAVQG